MKEHVLLSGGTGVLGKELLQKLLAQKKKVIVLCRNPKPEKFSTNSEQITWYKADVSLPRLGLSKNVYHDISTKISTIFHLAARTDFNGNSLEDYRPANIDGVKNIYQLACDCGVHLHHVSTAFVCGYFSGLFLENELDINQKFRNFYEESKFLGERYLQGKMESGPVQVTIYRPSIILERSPSKDSGKNFGPFTFLDATLRILLAARRRNDEVGVIRLLGERQAHLPFVFNDSVADALLNLSGHEHGSSTFHLVTNSPFANQILEDIFNDVFGRQVICWAKTSDFQKHPMTAVEKLLARNTEIYDNYLNLLVSFDRSNLDGELGNNFLADLNTDEIFQAFTLFLAQKKDSSKVIYKQDDLFEADVQNYFSSYLPQFFNQPLIKNLSSLNASLWLTVQGVDSWSINIRQGCLMAVSQGKKGKFGYTINKQAFLDIVRGQTSPQEGFFKGLISIKGNTKEALRTATALEEFFRRYPY